MDSIYADDSETQAINDLVATWEEDAPKEPSDTQEVETDPEDHVTDPEVDEEEAEEEAEGEGQEETPDEGEGEEEEGEEADNEEEGEDPQEAPTVITVKVDGEEREVSVDELTRLYGQEAALTRKSQEVADQRRNLEQVEQRYEATMERVLSEAKTEYEQYANIDWMVAQNQLDPEEFSALRSEALKAQKRFQSVSSEVGEYLQGKEESLKAELSEKAGKAHQTLLDSDIGWSKEKHSELAEFAETFGFSKEQVANFVDAPIFLLLNKAFEADKVTSQSVVKKKVKTPKKIITSKEKPKAINPQKTKATDLEKRLRASGSEDDAIALLMNNWN